MAIEVELEDRIVEFPDDWSEVQILDAVESIMGTKAPRVAESEFAPTPIPTSPMERAARTQATIPAGIKVPPNIEPLAPPGMDPNELAARGVAQEASSRGILPAAWEKATTPLKDILSTESIAQPLTQLQALVSPTMGASIARQRMAAGDPNLALEQIVTPEGRKLAQQISGANKTVAETVNFFTSPLGIATFGMGGLPKAAQVAISTAFAVQMGSAFPEIADELGREYALPESERDYEKISNLLTSAGANAFFTAAAGKHGIIGATQLYASSKSKAAKVHGDVQAQPVEGEGQVPAKEGGGGVQPQAEQAMAGASPLSIEPKITRNADGTYTVTEASGKQHGPYGAMDDARLAYEQIRERKPVTPPPAPGRTVADLEYEASERAALAEAEKLGAKAEVADTLPEGMPFARGQIATVTADGRILLNRSELRKWLADISPERRAKAIESLVSEEHIHTNVTNDMALSYWNSLTKAEQLLVQRRYTGKWAGMPERYSPALMGHEALRGTIQQLSRITPREIAEAGTFARMGMKTIYALEQLVSKIRQTLGTRASAVQMDILNTVQENLRIARSIKEGKAKPSAFRKAAEADPDKVLKMTPVAYASLSEKWTNAAMEGKGLSLQRQAEMAALERPDRTLWEAGLKQARAEAEAIVQEVKGKPETIMERQRDIMGAGLKAQFFSEGLKQLNGDGSIVTPEFRPEAFRKEAWRADTKLPSEKVEGASYHFFVESPSGWRRRYNVMLTRNTRPGEGPWRVTISDPVKPLGHVSGKTPSEALSYMTFETASRDALLEAEFSGAPATEARSLRVTEPEAGTVYYKEGAEAPKPSEPAKPVKYATPPRESIPSPPAPDAFRKEIDDRVAQIFHRHVSYALAYYSDSTMNHMADAIRAYAAFDVMSKGDHATFIKQHLDPLVPEDIVNLGRKVQDTIEGEYGAQAGSREPFSALTQLYMLPDDVLRAMLEPDEMARLEQWKNDTDGTYLGQVENIYQAVGESAARYSEQNAGYNRLRFEFDVWAGLLEDALASKAERESRKPLGPQWQQGELPMAFNKQTQSKEFRGWFGKSKVVDKKGNPKVAFHGTNVSIEQFDPAFADPRFRGGMFFLSVPGWNYPGQTTGIYRTGANLSAEMRANDLGGSAQVYPVFLRIEKPYIPGPDQNIINAIKHAKEGGYDGVIDLDKDGVGQYVVFDGNQVKSAIGNRGTWSRTDDRMAEAFRKKKDKQTGDLFAGAMGPVYDPEKGFVKPPPVAPEERVGAAEAGALPGLTGEDMANKLKEIISRPLPQTQRQQAAAKEEQLAAAATTMTDATIVPETQDRPRFSDYSDWAKRNIPGIREEQLRDSWENAVWKELLNAPPERLEQWRKALGYEGRFGEREVAPAGEALPPKERPTQEPLVTRESGGFVLTGEPLVETREQYIRAQREAEAEKGRRTEEKLTRTLERQELRKRIESRRKYRSRLIAEIATRLVEESYPALKSLERTEISIDDIDFLNRKTTFGAYTEIGSTIERDVDAIGLIMRDQARSGSRTETGKQLPITATKRLLVLVDRGTGETFLVSGYRFPTGKSRGNLPVYDLMVVDPTSPSTIRPNILLRRLLDRMRPVASILIDSPVQNFRQRFETFQEFMDVMGRDAAERAAAAETDIAGEAAVPSLIEIARGEGGRPISPEDLEAGQTAVEKGAAPIEGTPGIRGEGGGVTGKEAGAARAMLGVGAGEMQRTQRVPITPNELKSLYEFLFEDLKKIESVEDLKAAMESMRLRAEMERSPAFTAKGRRGSERLMAGLSPRARLRGLERSALSAIYKIANHFQRRYEDITAEGAYAKALDWIYETTSLDEGQNLFIATGLGRFAPPPEHAVGLARLGIAVPKPKGVERELTMYPRVPPTVTRYEAMPPSAKRWLEPPKGPQAPPPTAPKPLTPEQVSNLNKMAGEAAKAHPFQPMRPKESEALARLGITLWEPVPWKSADAYYEWLRQRSGLSPSEYKGPESLPEAFRKRKRSMNEVFLSAKSMLAAGLARRDTEAFITRIRDGADSSARVYAQQAGNAIRVFSANPDIRAAAKAVIAAGGVRSDLLNFKTLTQAGAAKAAAWITSGDPIKRTIGKAWKSAAEQLEKELEFAHANWNNQELKDTVAAAKRELLDEFNFETNNGISLVAEKNYVPGRYDSEFYNDNAIMFGEQRVLGRSFRKPRVFRNYYEAISVGPYIPKSADIADLAEHRIRQGRLQVNKRLWLESTKNIIDPYTNEPVSRAPIKRDGKAVSPTMEYELFSLGPGSDTIAVRKGYERLFNVLTARGGISQSTAGRAGLALTGFLKHGVILIFDTFHPARLFQYNVAALGKNAGYKGGVTALEYREADLPMAVQRGLVTPESAAWASGQIEITTPTGHRLRMTRRQILEQMVKQGLNVGRISDAIYSDLVQNIPVVGKMNKWIFDKVTRGMLAETAVRNFEEANKKYPGTDLRRVMADTIKDANFYYGSLGRQGILRNPTLQEIAQLVFLAPQWVEGLLQKETRFLSRATGLSWLAGRRDLPTMGLIGKGVGRGIASFFVLTQLINLITRQQFTWQNDEEGHKLDAWVPTGSGPNDGFWINPMTVFLEVTHDIMRYAETRPKAWDALTKIGHNKLGIWGRVFNVLWNSESARGEKITTTKGVLKAAAEEALPIPISLGKPAQYALSKAGVMAPPQRGSVVRQVMGSLTGVKVQTAETAAQQIGRLAGRFLKENNLTLNAVEMSPTDEASYSKLRNALRNEDYGGARDILDDIRKVKTDAEIVEGMERWAKRYLTGSEDREALFMLSLEPHEVELYGRALQERVEDLTAFYEWFVKQM